MPSHRSNRHPLYRPDLEHDACGVGLLADVAGQARRDVVTTGLSALVRLTHRGAPAELDTIDGCGVMTAIPWRVIDRQIAPARRDSRLTRALGAFFMPTGAFDEAAPIVERELVRAGGSRVAWRRVPVEPDALAPSIRRTAPRSTMRSSPSTRRTPASRGRSIARASPSTARSPTPASAP